MRARMHGARTALTAALVVLGLCLGASPSIASGSLKAGSSPSPKHAAAHHQQSGHHHKPKPPKWKPPTGVAFNNPYGSFDERFALEHRILEAIRHAPKKGFIRIAVYSFDRVPMAQALMAAHSRGVHVQVLLNDHEVTGAERILFHGLGQDRHKKSFAYECVESCRGHAHNLHTKFYLFSKSGGASRVIMLGSDNLTLNAVKWQWNDLYTRYGAKNQYHSYVQLFDSMRHDYSKNQPYYVFCGHAATRHHKARKCDEAKDFMVTRVYPKHTHADNDDIMEALNAVTCVYGTKAGVQHTRVWVVMHTWRGTRGNYLAAKVRSLWAAGCDVKVDYGLIGFHTKQIIGAKTARGRIPLRSLGFDYNDDGVVDRYTHQKNFTILGDWHGNKNAAVAFTGSSNFSTLGTAQDEIVVSLRSRKIVHTYNVHFMLQWNSKRYSRNAYTTTYSDYGQPNTEAAGGGATRPMIRVRVKHVLNLPDHLRPGKTWESD
ncbi:MAG TPA: phospholipase D-like domain-containing protein [Nocardioides sp.]|nr:phospholipase D-like domain-containing protein [Nocardioides sp.]